MTQTIRDKDETPQPPTSRVLLGLERSEPAQELLSTAIALARGLHAELAGLFVEDVALLRMAALPFTREVGRSSGVARPIEVADLERTLHRQGEQVRRGLARIAVELALPWSFRVARGSLLDEVLGAAVTTDLIVLGARRWSAGSAVGARVAPAAIVSALFDATEAGHRALLAALELAEGRPEQLSLLVPGASASNLRALRQRAAQALHVAVDLPRLQPLAAPEAGHLAQHTRRQRSRALVLSLHSLRDPRTELRVLLEAAGCPVVLVP
jgi:hypothetical protein